MDPIAPITGEIRAVDPIRRAGLPAVSGFSDMLKEAMAEYMRLEEADEVATRDFATGKTTDVAATMIAGERADIAFRLMLQVRNLALEAYQEIQRMQV